MENDSLNQIDIPFFANNSTDDIEPLENESSVILQNYVEDINFDPKENLMDIDNNKEIIKQSIKAQDWEKIEDWLKDLYNGEQVPLYEKNEETYYALSIMMWKSIEKNSLLKITKGNVRENLKLEYEIKGEKYKKF